MVFFVYCVKLMSMLVCLVMLRVIVGIWMGCGSRLLLLEIC